LWTPPAPEVRALQALVSRLEALHQMHTQEENRLATAQPLIRGSIEKIIGLLDAEIAALKQQIRDHIDGHPGLREQARLLESIPGVGAATIAQLLAVLGDLTRFKSARQLAAFLGLTPRQRQSGSSVLGKTRMAKMGHSQLRKALFFPAIVATRFNPLVRAFAQRLAQTGKSKMAIVGAAMRKLVHIIFGVLKSGRPFDPTMHVACA
jgi:transposase